MSALFEQRDPLEKITDDICKDIDGIADAMLEIKNIADNFDQPMVNCKCGHRVVDTGDTVIKCRCGNALHIESRTTL